MIYSLWRNGWRKPPAPPGSFWELLGAGASLSSAFAAGSACGRLVIPKPAQDQDGAWTRWNPLDLLALRDDSLVLGAVAYRYGVPSFYDMLLVIEADAVEGDAMEGVEGGEAMPYSSSFQCQAEAWVWQEAPAFHRDIMCARFADVSAWGDEAERSRLALRLFLATEAWHELMAS